MLEYFNLQLFAEGDAGGTEEPSDTNKGTEEHDGAQDKTYDAEYVKKLRKEAAAYRVKAKEYEEQLQAMPGQVAEKVFKALGINPDPEKNFEKQLEEAQQKAQEAEERANERLLRAEVKNVASDMGLVDADAALVLMDKTNITITDSGMVEGVKEALESLVEVKPWLKKEPKAGRVGGGTNPPGAGEGQENPWKPDSFNLTKQGEILRKDRALAERLKAEAGIK